MITYFPVHDLDYPRNRLIRKMLTERGYQVNVIDRGHRRFERATWKARLSALIRLFRAARSSDVIVVSEMSNQYAIIAWLACKLNHAILVVDGFIGLYETRVLDWRHYGPASIRARMLRLLDRVAFRLSDLYLIDTDERASELLRSMRSGKPLFTLPVGAPSWAIPAHFRPARLDPTSKALVLHYGNYAPLHGVDVIVEAFQILQSEHAAVSLSLVGDGPLRPTVERNVSTAGLNDVCNFTSRVSERDLLALINHSDIVLGIFGSSLKAGSVIPNKVWQGLACGRVVITRESPALAEIRDLVGDQLIQTPAGDAKALASAIESVLTRGTIRVYDHTASTLNEYVIGRFASFLDALDDKLRGRRLHSWRTRVRE